MKPAALRAFCLAGILIVFRAQAAAEDSSNLAAVPPGWHTTAPREEIKPGFAFDPHGGPESKGCFVIRSDSRDGLVGAWTRTFPVDGGKKYHVTALFKSKSVP